MDEGMRQRLMDRMDNAPTPPEPPKPRWTPPGWMKAIGLVVAGALITEGIHQIQFDELFADPPNDVMAEMRATPVKLSPRFYIANVRGVKLRDCPVKEGSFVGWAHDRVWRVTEFAFVDNPGSNVRRPQGFQDFGFWQWAIKPNDTAVKITLIHQCTDGEIHTEVGPFFIPRAIKIGEA